MAGGARNITRLFAVGVLFFVMAGMANAQVYVTNDVPGGQFNPTDPTYAEITGSPASGGGILPFVIDFPASGGNPGGYARIANPGGGGWGVWVIGNQTPVPLSAMGLTPGVPCVFYMDMRIESGTGPGGLKLESWLGNARVNEGPEVRPSGQTNTWATYAFPYTPTATADGMKIVGLWGAGSTNAFDNVRVRVTTQLPLNAAIAFPANLATVNTNFAITATAAVSPGTITNVYFYVGNTLVGNDEIAPYNFVVSGATPGPAQLKVVAKDSTGLSVTSAVVNVTISAALQETIVKVDPAMPWIGYMNVYQTPQNYGAFVFGQLWGVADLVAKFSGSGSASVLTLLPAPISTDDTYWYDYSFPTATNGAVGFKDMEANMYVQAPDGALNGNKVTFTGTVITNTLVRASSTNLIGNGWTCVAFIKDLTNDNSSFTETSIPVTNGMTFSISLVTNPDPERHIQYGFRTQGPNVWPTDVTNYGAVVIQSLDVTPTNVYVDSSKTWLGFMNWFETPQNGGAYVGGSTWGTADLKAVFDSLGLTLSPNNITNTDASWYTPMGQPGAVGNKSMDANMYVEIGSLPGRNLIFSGNVLSNTLVRASNTNAAGNGWTSVAFIKDFAPDYSSFNQSTVALTPGAFSINLTTVNDPLRHVQYGFETFGPNVWVTDSAPFGNVLIGNVAVLSPKITAGLSGGTLNLSFPTQLAHAYTVQYKTNLAGALWSTLTVTNGTGSTAVVTTSASNANRFYRLSIQ